MNNSRHAYSSGAQISEADVIFSRIENGDVTSIEARFALHGALPFAKEYLDIHQCDAASREELLVIATAQWSALLMQGYRSLDSLFSMKEFARLLEHRGGHLKPMLARPNFIEELGRIDDNFIDQSPLQGLPELVSKLKGLDYLQTVALGDLLWQVWNARGKPVDEVLARFGIELAD